ncbi:hypothetical protein CNR22_22565 [Sphingobacteriaceae bacterium]|nr:hypothetical protein CNR22_22565 [Sphingobacteriaceae bacterium]
MTQRLLSLRSIFFLLVVSTVFFGCTKSYRFKWVNYDETYCADRWEKNMNNERLKDNVIAYMDGKGVKIYEIEIITDRTPDSCTECTCKSGRRIKCKVNRGDIKRAKGEGFYE